MALPYVISGTVTLSSVAQANVSVIIRNERTNNSVSVISDSDGRYQQNAANITGEYVIGDIITAYSQYTSYEAEASHKIAAGEGGYTLDLALTAVSLGELRYFTVQDFLDFHNYTLGDEHVPTAQHLIKIGQMAEKDIDSKCNTVFDSNDGDYYTATDEYNDIKTNHDILFWTENRPVIAISSLSVDTATEGSTASWVELTEDTQFSLNKRTGRIKLLEVDDLVSYRPAKGAKKMKKTYTYGRASVPADINMLAILMTTKYLMLAAVGRSVIKGENSFNFASWTELDRQIEDIMQNYRFSDMRNT